MTGTYDLGNNGPDFARCGRETVGGRTVTGWEAFARHNEGGGVGAKVKEELGNDVKGKKAVR